MENYICKRAMDLSDKWRDAEVVTLTRNSDGQPPLFSTSAWLSYDQQNLYVLFSCADDVFHAAKTAFNDPIYEEDVVEIFIDVDCDQRTYVEFEVSPINTLLHYFVQNDLNGRFIGFARTEQRVTSQVRTDRADASHAQWQAELTIPLDELLGAPNTPPRVGDVWRFNLFRIKRNPDGSYLELSSLSNTQKDAFHVPECFIRLQFA